MDFIDFDENYCRKPSLNSYPNNFHESKSSFTLDELKFVRRKGDTIYFTKNENIHMQAKRSTDSLHVSSSPDDCKIHTDPLNSESSFKTFAFDENSNNLETEKCISFWKTVMERKLKPVKSSIIARKKEKSSFCEENKTFVENSEETIQNAINEVHSEYNKIWTDLIKEIQNKKLDEIRKNAEKRCESCEKTGTQTEIDLRAFGIQEPSKWQSITNDKTQIKLKVVPEKNIVEEEEDSTCDAFDPECIDKYLEIKLDELVAYQQDSNIANVNLDFSEKQKPESEDEFKSKSTTENAVGVDSSFNEILKDEDYLHLNGMDFQNTRRISILEPGGQKETLERDNISNLNWDIPSGMIRRKSSAKTSLELLWVKQQSRGSSRSIMGKIASRRSSIKSTNSSKMIRTVSMLLPSGEIKFPEKNEMESLDWEPPHNLNTQKSLLATVSSLELKREKESKSSKLFMKGNNHSSSKNVSKY